MRIDALAIGAILREAEKAGIVTALGDLRARVEESEYSWDEVDEAFAELVDEEGRVVGSSVQPEDVDPSWRDRLIAADLGQVDADRHLEFTPKAWTMLALLHAYADREQHWISNTYASGVTDAE